MMQEWPSVLIETTMHVVQQQLHLRHAIRGACTVRVGFFDSDSKIGHCQKITVKKFDAYSTSTLYGMS